LIDEKQCFEAVQSYISSCVGGKVRHLTVRRIDSSVSYGTADPSLGHPQLHYGAIGYWITGYWAIGYSYRSTQPDEPVIFGMFTVVHTILYEIVKQCNTHPQHSSYH
jgi:hypothetical protein